MNLWRRLQYLRRSRRYDADLAEELAFHTALKQESYQAHGLSSEAAHSAARRDLGNVGQIQEDARQVWVARQFDAAMQDIRYGIRTLAKNPGFTAMAVVALALGIGLNTVVFTVFNALVLSPWAVRDPATVVGLFQAPDSTGPGGHYSGFSFPSLQYLREHATKLSGVAAAIPAGSTTVNNGPVLNGGWFVTGNYLTMLGAEMLAGRGFVDEEDAPRMGKPVVVLSHRTWKNHFAGDPNIVGRHVRMNYNDFVVIGVTAPGFGGTSPTLADFYVPVQSMKLLDPSRDSLVAGDNFCCFEGYGRLAPGASRAEAAAEASVLLDQYRRSVRSRDTGTVYVSPATFISNPERESVVYPMFAIVMSAVTIILLIACANIANLLLARATARQREIGIRLSIGAGRRRLVRQLWTESLVLAAAGSVLALLLASVVTGPLMIKVSNEPLAFNFTPDLRVFAATCGVAVLATFVFGLAPALHATRASIAGPLHPGAPLARRLTSSRMRSVLLGMQVALSLILLVAAGLMTRALQKAQSIDPGFAVNNVVVMSVDLQLHNYKDEQSAAFWHQLQERVNALPNVQASAHAFMVPLGSARAMTGGAIDGKRGDKNVTFSANWVSPEYLATLQIPIVAGRDFRAGDKTVMIVNEAMAARHWPGVNPIGHFVQIEKERWEVVGIAKSVRSLTLSAPDDTFAFLVSDAGTGHRLFVRTAGDPRALLSVLPKLANSVDRGIRASAFLLRDNVAQRIARAQYLAAIAGFLGALALALACIGIYGVVSYTVEQRTREIGIRMALGAGKAEVLSAIIYQNARIVGAGAALGLLAAAGVSRVITSFLYGVSALDPISFGAVVLALLASALVATYVPARRAVMVDPASALRHE